MVEGLFEQTRHATWVKRDTFSSMGFGAGIASLAFGAAPALPSLGGVCITTSSKTTLLSASICESTKESKLWYERVLLMVTLIRTFSELTCCRYIPLLNIAPAWTAKLSSF